MAITVVDDFTTLSTLDVICGLTAIGGVTAIGMCPCTVTKAQGCASQTGKVMCSGLGGLVFDNTCTFDLTDCHIMGWATTLDGVNACTGWRIRLSGALACGNTTNFGDITVGTDVSTRGTFEKFISFTADPKKPFVLVTGTAPAVTAVQVVGTMANHTSCSGRCTYNMDEMKYGTGVTITGGTCTPRGSPELASDDATNGRGTFIDVAGINYVRGRITIGNTTACANSTWDDTNQVWNWEGLACAVSSTFHKLEFVGGTGTNRATFGSSAGCCNDKEGFGGNSFISGGCIPFRIEAICSSVTAEIFGSTLTGPSCLYDDHLQNYKVEDNSCASFCDDTRDANDSTANDALVFPACDATCDSANFGMDERFSLLKVNTGTAGVGTYTVTWEYSRCGGFTALTDVTDGTTDFKTTGCQTVSYSIPDDWIATCVGGDSRYWIRARRDAGTSTTNPLITQVKASLGGGVRWEHTNAEAIRVTFTNMDTIRVRNSAKLKKSIIQCTVAPAKSAALDLGSSDPTINTVRDLTIQNNINGILLKGCGNTTYNFRNLLFACNTQDVRVDFPMCDTVTINVLCCGDTPSTCNVNCSTIVVNNNVNITVTVLDTSGVAVSGARVGIFDAPVCIGEAALFCGTTNACGVFTDSHNFMCVVSVSTRVRLKGFIPNTTLGCITMCGLNVPVTFITDPNVNLP